MSSENPYHRLLVGAAERVAEWTPGQMASTKNEDAYLHWQPSNEWVYPRMANMLLVGSYAYVADDGQMSGAPELLDSCTAFLDYLVDAGVEDRWFHNQPGMGDPNIDRFTLLPLLETYFMLRDHLPGELRERIERRVCGVFKVQRNEYGKHFKNDPTTDYPNMDVYYCLIMYYAHRMTGRDQYLDEHDRFLDRLQDAQFGDGG
jgi:hypothetical protein